jgi:hypothetical protein
MLPQEFWFASVSDSEGKPIHLPINESVSMLKWTSGDDNSTERKGWVLQMHC